MSISDVETKKVINSDDIDISSLLISQEHLEDESASYKRIVTKVPCKRPKNTVFFRIHPSSNYQALAFLIEVEGDKNRETFILAPALVAEFRNIIAKKKLFLGVDRDGHPFFWPVRLADADGNLDDWNKSAMEAISEAQKRWVRVVPDRHQSGYEVMVALKDLGQPNWPKETLAELLNICFRDHYITDPNHYVLKELRGEI